LLIEVLLDCRDALKRMIDLIAEASDVLELLLDRLELAVDREIELSPPRARPIAYFCNKIYQKQSTTETFPATLRCIREGTGRTGTRRRDWRSRNACGGSLIGEMALSAFYLGRSVGAGTGDMTGVK
jgi:hypothetical protein